MRYETVQFGKWKLKWELELITIGLKFEQDIFKNGKLLLNENGKLMK